MRRLLYFFIFLFLSSTIIGQENPLSTDFIVMRLDYQSFAVKHLYHFTGSVQMENLIRGLKQYHGLYVTLVPPGDFGSITVTSAQTNDIVYKATTIWDGTGVHEFPTENFEISAGDSTFHHGQEPLFYDLVDYHFEKSDYEELRQAWAIARNIKLPFAFPEGMPYGVLSYLHYFSVGPKDPSTAEWIFIFYTLPDDVTPYLTNHWVDISNNLPDTYIHTIAPHYFFGDSLWIGTNQGAFHSITGGDKWLPVYLENDDMNYKVTASAVIPNPYVNCLCSVVGLGTTDQSDIPEQMSGSVFRSLLDGNTWEFLKSPDMSVTALAFNYWNPYTVYAGLFSPYIGDGGLFRLKNNSEWERIEFAPEISYISIINCITIDIRDTNRIFIGTNKGLFYTDNNGQTWNRQLTSFDIVSIIMSYKNDCPILYAATGGTGRSDGVWASFDGGETWEVLSWETRIVSLVQAQGNIDISVNRLGRFYMAVYDKGVFESLDGCRTWNPINIGLNEKRVTSLATHPSKQRQLYLGTENGIFKFEPYLTEIDLSIANDDLAYWPPHPKDGELVEIYATIHNNSPHDVFNVKVSFDDNADGSLTVIVPIDTLVIPTIHSYSDYTLRAEWYPLHQDGNNIIHVHVDPQNQVIETDETNNQARINIFLESQSQERKWNDITFNLRNIPVNDIAAHPFNSGEVYVATDKGAFSNAPGNINWEQLKFDQDSNVRVMQIVAEAHPFLDWTVPVLWLGTEEYNLIPEDRLGRVFRSENGGREWWNTGIKNVSVSAIEARQQNSLQAYVALYNAFYYIDNFYFLKDSTWIEFDLTPGDSDVYKINFIKESPENEKMIYIGTDHGLFISQDGGSQWKTFLNNFDIVSLVFFKGNSHESIYIATSGRSKSDGIYRMTGNDGRWEIVSYFTDIVSLVSPPAKFATEMAAPYLYLAVYNRGVLVSRNGGYRWDDITENFLNLEMTCLATDRIVNDILYLGTKNGIFIYDLSNPTNVAEPQITNALPTAFQLSQNYPNPFNSSTVIRYQIPLNLAGEDMIVKFYNALGQEVQSYRFERQTAGVHKFTWDGKNHRGEAVNSGIYFCRIWYGNIRRLIKIAYLK